MTAARILDMIESGDALAGMLQTLRLNPTPENAQRVCLQLDEMARESAKLAHALVAGT